MKIKYEYENFSLEGLTLKEVGKAIRRKTKKSEYWKWIVDKHEIGYIVNYLGPLLIEDNSKHIIKGATAYDLFNVYYMDYTIKNKLLITCQKVERYLKVSMIQEMDGDFKTDRSRSFGSKIDLYNKNSMNVAQKSKIMKHFERVTGAKFETMEEFHEFLESVKRIRNFCAHSYNEAAYYDWNTNFAKGTYRFQGTNSFRNDFKQLMRAASNGTIRKLREFLIEVFEHRPFTTNEIGVMITEKYLGCKTIYSFDWNSFMNKRENPYGLNKFLKANSRYKPNKDKKAK